MNLKTKQNEIIISTMLSDTEFMGQLKDELGNDYKAKVDWEEDLITFRGNNKIEFLVISEIVKMVNDANIKHFKKEIK